MPNNCCVYDCMVTSEKNPELSFFGFPKEQKLREAWIKRIRRDNFTPTNNTRVCIRHFLPSDIRPANPDTPVEFQKKKLFPGRVPSLNLRGKGVAEREEERQSLTSIKACEVTIEDKPSTSNLDLHIPEVVTDSDENVITTLQLQISDLRSLSATSVKIKNDLESKLDSACDPTSSSESSSTKEPPPAVQFIPIPLPNPSSTDVAPTQIVIPQPAHTPIAPAGVTIPHDGLPTISSVHSIQAGKSMTFPVGKVEEKTSAGETMRYVHPWQIVPRYIQPGGKVVYQPGMPSRFVHPVQMIPLHIPQGAPGAEAMAAAGMPAGLPPGFHPIMPGQTGPDGKQVPLVFYPVSIPVNAVRPFVKEKTEGESEKGDPSLVKVKPEVHGAPPKEEKVVDIHPRNTLKSPPRSEDQTKVIADEKRVQTKSEIDSKDNFTEEFHRLSAKNPREALQAKKGKKLLGIVDRVTEVAASKQCIEDQKKSLDDAIANAIAAEKAKQTTVIPVHSHPHLVPPQEIQIQPMMEQPKLLYAINESGQPTIQAFHPRFTLLPSLKETDIEKVQRLHEFSALDNVRNILKAPPDFVKNPVQLPGRPNSVPRQAALPTAVPINPEGSAYIHPRKVLYNNPTPPRRTPTPPNAFEKKVITEINNSINSLHAKNPKNRVSPNGLPINDSNDIFRELERKAILEAKEFSKHLDEKTNFYPSIATIEEQSKSSTNDTTLDSDSEEYHALKEISILQSSLNPIVQSGAEPVLPNYGAPSLQSLMRPMHHIPSAVRQITPNVNTTNKTIHEFKKTKTEYHRSDDLNFDKNNDSFVYDSDFLSDDESYVDEMSDDELVDDFENDYEKLYEKIKKTNCMDSNDYSSVDFLNPNIIVENILLQKEYSHIEPPSDSEYESDDESESENEKKNEINGEANNENTEINKEPSEIQLPALLEKRPRETRVLTYPGKNKKIEEEADNEDDGEKEESKSMKNGEEHLPDRTDREKRPRVDVFYKDTRTNFMNGPISKRLRKT